MSSEISQNPPALRPCDAAALILVDRSKSNPLVLMGKRSNKHVFMPNLYVFPGGRRDRHDSRLPIRKPLNTEVTEQLLQNTTKRFTAATAHGLAIAAARELGEETGLNLNHNSGFDLSNFRFVTRAITPKGQVRRFDTRFFACFCDEVAIEPANAKDSDELIDLQWINIHDPGTLPMPEITKTVLKNVSDSLRQNAELPFTNEAPSYLNI